MSCEQGGLSPHDGIEADAAVAIVLGLAALGGLFGWLLAVAAL